MRAFVRIPLVLAALLLLLAAPASTRAALPRGDPGLAGHDLLVLRSGNPAVGSLIALPAGGHASRQLPPGLFDRSGRTLYSAYPQGEGQSVVQAMDVASGRVLRSTTVAGNFSTATGDYVPGALLGPVSGRAAVQRAPSSTLAHIPSHLVGREPQRFSGAFPVDTSQTLSALSFNGRWLALRDATPGATATNAVVLDTTAMRVVATLRLNGIFGLDAITADGTVLYLIQTLAHSGPQAYQVRLYDVKRGRLDPNPLRENDEASSIIRGVAYTRVWSPHGDWLFTLYVQPGRSGAFVHALGVAYRRVHCIVLHDGAAAAADLAHYALAVSSHGSALYAVNPVLGRMVAVRGGLPYGARERANLGRRARSPQQTQTGAVLSRDGRALFVATDRGVWVIDTHALAVRTIYRAGQNVASVALSRDGRRLYALEPDQGVVEALDAAGGRVLGRIPVDTGSEAVWSIEQVMSQE